MDFTNSFTVSAPRDQVWEFMLDAEQVAPCVPGATLAESIDPTHHKGTVKVKLGAVQMTYRGELAMEPDPDNYRIVLHAKGTEARGSGGATGTFTSRLTEVDEGTLVEIDTHVDVTGKVAQFGRGIMQDVAGRMIKQFATCLEQKIQAQTEGQPGGDGAAVEESAPAAADSAEASTTMPAESAETAPETLAVSPSASTAGPDSVRSPAAPSSPAPAGTAATAPTTRTAPRQESSTAEISMGKIVADITRSRLASGLRALAGLIDPD